MSIRKIIPWAMVVFRAIAGAIIPLLAWKLPSPELWLGLLATAGFLSDVYDGILARRWGTATAPLRLADSAIDTLFYLGILAAVILRHGSALRERSWLLAGLLALEAARHLFDWLKYRRMASYHTYASRLWGALLASATIALLCFNSAFFLLTFALAWGILCDLEGLLISILLPEWKHDVKSIPRAFALRREMLTRAAVS